MEHSRSLGSSRLRHRREQLRRCLRGRAHLEPDPHPTGTTNVRLPSENPLKLSAPFTPVSPAMSWNRAVRAAALKLSHVGSIACCCARSDAAPRGIRTPTSAMTVPTRRAIRDSLISQLLSVLE